MDVIAASRASAMCASLFSIESEPLNVVSGGLSPRAPLMFATL